MRRIKALLKKLRSLAKKTKLDICFEDECHFQQHGSRCKMWIPPEDKDPVVKHAPTRKSISLFGAVYATTGKMVSMVTTIFNAETFLSFLKKLLKSKTRGRKLLVVLDNAKYHHAVMLRPWLETNKAKIELLFLPPYSPELNHIERVWKLARRLCTHNRYFATLSEIETTINEQMKYWRKPNDELKKLCCII